MHHFEIKGSLFYSTLLLTAGSLGLRLVQMLFQIYISGVMGAEGLGRMQLILTVGSFATIVASGGVRIASTCLAAEETGRGSSAGTKSAITCCCLFGLVLSILVALVLFFSADMLSFYCLSDLGASFPLRILAVFLPFNILWAIFAGYFTAAGRVPELVGLEFAERLISIALVVLGIRLNFRSLDPCSVIFLGSSLATALSFLILFGKYQKTMAGISPSPLFPMIKRLIKLTVPLGFNDILRSCLGTVENLLVPKGLQKSGESSQSALAAFGTINGMVFPVIMFPSVLLFSLSDLLVPEMAKCRARERSQRIVFLSEKCLRLTVMFSMLVSGVCFLLGDELGALLYHSQSAGVYIRIFAPMILVLYADAITDGILKGLSQQLYTVRYNTITSFLDVVLLFLLLPHCGIYGFIVSFTVTHVLNFFLSIRRLILETGYLPNYQSTLRAGISCLIAGFTTTKLCFFSCSFAGIFFPACAFIVLYLALLRITGALTREDVEWLKRLISQRESHPQNPGQI